jgi:F0F1-type ATP synthase delta subunit
MEEALATSLENVEGLFCYLANEKLKDIKSEVLSILQKAKSNLRGTVKSTNALHKRAETKLPQKINYILNFPLSIVCRSNRNDLSHINISRSS